MTVYQAMQSGKKFRRPGFKPFQGQVLWLVSKGNDIVFTTTGINWKPRREDILADDWVIEEIKKEFTFEELFQIFDRMSPRPLGPLDRQELEIALGFKQQEMHTFFSHGSET